MAKDSRARAFATVGYPESLASDWREQLEQLHVPCLVSPLHDSDVNADGEVKKPHYHILWYFQGKKSLAQVQEICDSIGAIKPQVAKDLRAYARYLCHLDNPEKHQYSPADVLTFGGADYLEKIGSAADTDSAVGEMMDWCIEQGCYSFFELANFARRNRPDWFRVISSKRTVFLKAWLQSYQWEMERGHDVR